MKPIHNPEEDQEGESDMPPRKPKAIRKPISYRFPPEYRKLADKMIEGSKDPETGKPTLDYADIITKALSLLLDDQVYMGRILELMKTPQGQSQIAKYFEESDQIRETIRKIASNKSKPRKNSD